ncbi:hypothetical protein DL240_04910 [Lujinxingia litoralis]|uniref:Rod shape-determining protein MreD n=1 Tax=Lujinxingia litoralis TaxID=2211119 RepID=A0A328C6N5_9DELT|nr:hypothetical protein [Lujinxingia litoralis]RAL23503.1 hypothetical protein DL240_04910 [Lujinxingia litoralis]
MPTLVLVAMAWLLLVIQGALGGLVGEWVVPQIGIALVVFLGLERSLVRGGVVLLALMWPVEWFVTGVPGVYSFALVAVFFVMQLLRGRVQPTWGIARGVVAALATLGHSLMMLLVFTLSESNARVMTSIGWQMWASAFSTALATLVVGRLLSRMDRVMDPRRGRNVLEFRP